MPKHFTPASIYCPTFATGRSAHGIEMKDFTVSARDKKILIWICAVLIMYAAAGFWLFPAILHHQVPRLIEEKTARKASIEAIYFNPFTMELAVDAFAVTEQDGSPFSSFQRFYINLAVWRSLFNLTLTFDQIDLCEPFVLIRRNKQGDFNFADLLAEKKKEETPTQEKLFPVTVSSLKVSEGKLSWHDNFYSTPSKEDIYPLNLNMSNLTTIVNQHSKLGFDLSVASGGSLSWEGGFSLNPLASQGHITLERLSFPKLWSLFLKDIAQFEILKGTERLDANYQLNDSDRGIQLLVSNAKISIVDVELSEKGKQAPLVSVPDFGLSGITFNLLEKKIRIADVSSRNAQFKTWLNPDGSINYQSLFAVETGSDSAQTSTKNTGDPVQSPWDLRIDQLSLNNFALDFTDKTLPDPANVKLSALQLNIQDISNQPGSRLPFNVKLNVNDGGKLALTGETILEPFSTRLQINADAIAIKNFQPYLDQAVRLDVISGLLNVNADLSVQQQKDQPLALHIQGDSQIADLITRDRIANKDFLNWKRLSLDNMDIDIGARRFQIERVKLDQPYARVQIRKDKSINVSDVIAAPNPASAPAQQPAIAKTPAPPPEYSVSRIEIHEGESDFSDLSLILPFSAHINRLQGEVKGIASERNAVAQVRLDGRVDDLSPVNIAGQINPHRGDSEFNLDFNNLSLPVMTPYMAEFAGRKIEKGNMSLALQYKIKDQQLTATNKLLINHLVLGEKVQNPDAVSLPLDLAIALLEDRNGKIALDVPISGSLEDPKFSVGGIIVDALVNVISKVVTAPFSAIASLIGSDEDISQITFPAGKAELTASQKEKLDGLAKALTKRPALQLEIKGTAYTGLDWPPLQGEALYRQLLLAHVETLNRKQEKKLNPENVQISEEDYQRLLADTFIQKFPQLAERSLFGTPQLIDPQTGEFYSVAERKLAAQIPPDQQRLAKLASARAKAIAKYLVAKGIAVDRLYLLDTDIVPPGKDEVPASHLSLAVH